MSGPETVKVKMRYTMPEDPENREIVESEAQRYAECVAYLATFIEGRVMMGDVDSAYVFNEFKMNVCRHMVGDYDIFGTQ